MQIEFEIDGMRLTRTSDAYVTEGSKNFVQLLFTFSDDWNGIDKWALFARDNKTYEVAIVDGKCIVPYECARTQGQFQLTVVGKANEGEVIATTSDKAVRVSSNEFEENPTGSETRLTNTFLVDTLASAKDYADKAKEYADKAASAEIEIDKAVESAQNAATSEKAAKGYADKAKEYSESVNVFIPSVDADGVMTWTNKAGLANPAPVSVKGERGEKGERGATGAKGERGEQGPQGLQGLRGEKGDTGAAASIKIGTVTTGAAGSNASVTNSGTASNVVLDFTLPRGEDGADGGIVVDTAMSDTSTNPVQNKVIKAELDKKMAKTDKIYEANLEWGGKNFTGSYGCIDATMIPDLGANRLAFGRAKGITVEYSTDAGETWLDYGYSDIQKIGIFATGQVTTLGKSTSTTITNDCMLRITIDTKAFGVYTSLNKFAFLASANTTVGAYCTIDASLKATPDVFVTFADKIAFWGGPNWNIINTRNLITYGNTPSFQYGLIRFTFGCTSVTPEDGGISVQQILGFGGVGWEIPSNMAKHGHLYDFNNLQEAIFPAAVTAPNFIGKVNNKTIEASVPANAKFTDTVYTHPATHPASMITGLSTVATSGSYNDLTDKPNIPASATVDSELSSTSTNPVQNKAIYNALLNKVGTDIFSGFALMGATSTIAWRQGSQAIGSINATNYTGTAARATQDGAGNVITETYATKSDISGVVKRVNGTKPDTDGNVVIDVSGGGGGSGAYLPLTGGTVTGGITAPNFQTGTGAANYFQCRKFRGEGNADSYYHAIDFGYSGHDSVDFYEYDPNWNFYKCLTGTKSGAVLVGNINGNGWNGGARLSGTPTAPTAAAGTNTTQIATTAFVQSAIPTNVSSFTNDAGYIKSVNNIKPDLNGNVTIAVSGGGGVSTSESNTWTGKQTFQKMKFNFESYNAPRISGATDNPSSSVAVYNVQGNFTLDMSTLAGLLSNGDATVFTAYITANGSYTLSITNAGTLKYAGSATDLAITANGLLLNIMLIKSSSGVLSSVAQASTLS